MNIRYQLHRLGVHLHVTSSIGDHAGERVHRRPAAPPGEHRKQRSALPNPATPPWEWM
jgi:hypothetical protein